MKHVLAKETMIMAIGDTALLGNAGLTVLHPNRSDEISVIVVCGLRAVAEAIGAALDAREGIHVVSAGTEATRDIQIVADVAIVEVDLDGARGMNVVEDLVSTSTRVVAIAAIESAILCERVLTAGAAGFVGTNASLDRIIECVRAAASDRAIVPADLLTQMVGARARGRGATLTPRELQMLQLCSVGWSTREIAAHFVLSVNTVRTHVQNALTKLGARSRLEAVAKAVAAGLIEPGTRSHASA